MRSLIQDIRYGLRMLAKKPGFTLAVTLILALGIGANTAMFSVVNGVLLRPLPYKEPDRIVQIWENNIERGMHGTPVSPLNFLDWRDQNQVFEHMAAYEFASFNLTGVDEPKTIKGLRVCGSILDVTGIAAVLGRTFSPDEDRSGDVVVLNHGLWQRGFGSDPAIIGQTLTLDGKPFTVIGIMPTDFCFPRRGIDLWVPLILEADDPGMKRSNHYLSVLGRLRPEVTVKQAQVQMDAISHQLGQEYPQTNAGFGVTLAPLHEAVVGDVRPALLALLGAVGFVLLIACANVANLLLARSMARQKEMAVRSALGASRLRLIRQLLAESMLLALVAAPFGVLLSLWGIHILIALGPRIPRFDNIGIDARVLAFTGAVSLLTGTLFGLLPALQNTKTGLSESLKEGSARVTGSRRRQGIRNALVISEIAIACVLLVCAGLMLNSFCRLYGVDPGFKPTNVMTIGLKVPGSKYPEAHQRIAFYRQAIRRIGRLPGIQSVGGTHILPLTDNNMNLAFGVESSSPLASGKVTGADYRRVSHNYFRTMTIPLLKGRSFTERDDEETPAVAIINEAMARRFWPDEDPIGERLIIGDGGPNPREIVGVVGSVRRRGLHAQTTPMMYVPYFQCPKGSMSLVVRAARDPVGVLASVRSEVRAIDKDLPVSRVTTMEQILARSVSLPRFNVVLFGGFATAALILAAMGIYSVMAYSVSERRHEIGIRIALGAQARDVLQMVVRQGLTLALIGVAIGLAVTFGLTRVITHMLYQISPTDPLTFVCVSLLLAGVALLASYIPARRAAKIDPMEALRYE